MYTYVDVYVRVYLCKNVEMLSTHAAIRANSHPRMNTCVQTEVMLIAL